jgi:hypothetical protein
MNIKKLLLLVAGCFVIGAASGYYLSPTKVTVRTEIKEVVKEVERKEKDSKKDKKNDKIVIIVETILPDGTKKKETKIVDKGTITIDTSETSERETDKTTDTKTEKVTERARDSFQVYGIAGVKMTDWAAGPEYGAGVTRRLLGPIWIGAYGTTRTNVGVTLGIGF